MRGRGGCEGRDKGARGELMFFTRKTAVAEIYTKMRQQAFELRFPASNNALVHVVLMDWKLERGTTTVVAAADGSASMYLSNGGGYVGGGQKDPWIHEFALNAVDLAGGLLKEFKKAKYFDLPNGRDVFFYATTAEGVFRGIAPIAELKDGSHRFSDLGNEMQKIINGYRRISVKAPENGPKQESIQ